MKKSLFVILLVSLAGLVLAQESNGGAASGPRRLTVVVPVGEPVDLGLPSGIKWSSMDIGATSEYDEGDCFAWAETVGYKKGAAHQFTRDNYSHADVPTRMSITQDAAQATWAGCWRIPTKTDWEELFANCTKIEQYQDGKHFVVFTRNGHSVTLQFDKTYWTSEASSDNDGTCIFANPGLKKVNQTTAAFSGLYVRPVWDDVPVDFGLSSGTLWAKTNLGSEAFTDCGKYYAWGEVVGYTAEDGHKWLQRHYIHDNSLSQLPSQYDAAYQALGGHWQIPTVSQWNELKNNTNCTKIVLAGRTGYLLEGKTDANKGKWIFMPCAGYDATLKVNEMAYYQTSTYQYTFNQCVIDMVPQAGPLENGLSIRPVTSYNTMVTVSSSAMTLQKGSGALLSYDVSPAQNVIWSSDNTAVAQVNDSGMVRAVGIGTAVITVASTDGSGAGAQCQVTVEAAQTERYVDMGTGVLWATFDIGAEVGAQGKKYAWGEIEPKDSYTESNFVDVGYTLDIHTDVATTTLGGNWRIPTEMEWKELLEICETRVGSYTVGGKDIPGFWLVSKTTAKQMFIPCYNRTWNGVTDDRETVYPTANRSGYYVSCVRFKSHSLMARTMQIANNMTTVQPYLGLPVRAVCDNSAVDLGLPSGTLWSSRNVGAAQPEKTGLFFAWGNIDGYAKGSGHMFNIASNQYRDDVSVLPPAQDAATVHNGWFYHIPSRTQWEELGKLCQWENVGSAARVTGPNGRYIYLPAPGLLENDDYKYSDRIEYWTNEGYSSSMAWEASSGKSGPSNIIYREYRQRGAQVRGVREPLPQSVELSMTYLGLPVDSARTLTANVLPEKANQNLVWNSSNPYIASVDENGVVTGKAVGEARITAASSLLGGVTAQCRVVVTVKPEHVVKADSIRIWGDKDITLVQNASVSAAAYVYYGSDYTTDVLWRSKNPNIATVNSDGTIRGIRAGETFILACDPKGGKACDTIRVTVTKSVLISRISGQGMLLMLGEQRRMQVNITPSDATNQTLHWSATNSEVATVDSTGMVTAKGVGSTSIYIDSRDGSRVWDYVDVVVTQPYVDLGLSVKWMSMNLGADDCWSAGQIRTSGAYASDPASTVFRSTWRLPTNYEWRELRDSCTWTWIENSFIQGGQTILFRGYRITSNCAGFTDQSIYLPSSSDCMDSLYWSKELFKSAISEQHFVRAVTGERPVEPQMIDLGLSVKWADANLGAFREYEYGTYYAWAETSGKVVFSWMNYLHADGAYNALLRYNTDARYGMPDGVTVIRPEDDAATALWGNGYRMPTEAEIAELKDRTRCTWEWFAEGNTDYHGVAGYKITGIKTGKSIFLPAAGCYFGTGLQGRGTVGNYWSSSLNKLLPIYGRYLCFDPYDVCEGYHDRSEGRPIRAVHE